MLTRISPLSTNEQVRIGLPGGVEIPGEALLVERFAGIPAAIARRAASTISRAPSVIQRNVEQGPVLRSVCRMATSASFRTSGASASGRPIT